MTQDDNQQKNKTTWKQVTKPIATIKASQLSAATISAEKLYQENHEQRKRKIEPDD